MRILAVDIGTGTQDILLFDSTVAPENCFKLVMPAPTRIYAAQVRRATAARLPVFLAGTLMGGGPVGWAAADHLKAGLPVYATPEAARTLDDDLDRVRAMGVRLTGGAEDAPKGAATVVLGDLDLTAIRAALAAFGLEESWDGLAVAVLDHGEAPPTVSDRAFRFAHIQRVLAAGLGTVATEPAGLMAFAYLPAELPAYLTRLRAVAAAVPNGLPALLMDTGPAAGLGALEDPRVRRHRHQLLVNIGNMHTLATLLRRGRVAALLEHHTGRLTADALMRYLEDLAAGCLTNDQVFADQGHGCFQATGAGLPSTGAEGSRPFLAVSGPRRGLLTGARRSDRFAPGSPYLAVPHGDMMIAGCWGLVRAFAHKVPAWRAEIMEALART